MQQTNSGDNVKNLVGIVAAGVCATAVAVGGVALAQQPAHAASNCRSYGVTSAASHRAITAACNEVAKGTPYSWAGGHGTQPGPSTGVVHDGSDGHFDDRNRVGLDCSGLVRWAWFQATGTDFGAGGTQVMPAELTSHGFTRTGDTGPTRPGDIVLYPGHTAIYLGAGLVVQAANQDAGLNVAGLSTEPSTMTGVFRYVAGAKPQPRVSRPPKPKAPPKPRTRPATATPKPTPKATPKHAEPRPKSTPSKSTPSKSKAPKSKVPKANPPKTKPPKATATVKYQQVRADAPTYFVPVAWHDVGVLHKGKHRVECQVMSVGHSFRGKHSNWWVKTDDSSGNHNVWVSATYLSGAGSGRVAGVPTC